MQLGKYFTLREMVRSSVAEKNHIDNTPLSSHVMNMKSLVENILDPLRKAYGGPIRVTSGYRCAALNAAVGGSKNSQHMVGEAADIIALSPSGCGKHSVYCTLRLFELIQELGLPFDQLINEGGGSWVHVSYRRDGKNRGMVLRL